MNRECRPASTLRGPKPGRRGDSGSWLDPHPRLGSSPRGRGCSASRVLRGPAEAQGAPDRAVRPSGGVPRGAPSCGDDWDRDQDRHRGESGASLRVEGASTP